MAVIQATGYLYIVRDENILSGQPIVKGTRTPLGGIAKILRMGTVPEEILTGLSHLMMAQVFDTLGYYSNRQDEINAHIERNRIPDELIDPLVEEDLLGTVWQYARPVYVRDAITCASSKGANTVLSNTCQKSWSVLCILF